MKRLPIDASAKCSGTRSGVSMIRVSSVAITADIHLSVALSNIRLPELRVLKHQRYGLRIKPMLFSENAGREILDRVVVHDGHNALRDDRAAVQSFINIMNRAARPFHTVIQRLLLRIQSGKRRKQTRVNVENAIAKR